MRYRLRTLMILLAVVQSLAMFLSAGIAAEPRPLTDADRVPLRRQHVLVGHSKEVTSLEFSPDGRHMVSGSLDQSVCYWQIDPIPQLLSSHLDCGERVWSIAFSDDGKRVATGDFQGKVRLWKVAPDKLVPAAVFAADDVCVWSVSFGPKGSFLATAGADGSVKIWDVADKAVTLRNTLDAFEGPPPGLGIHITVRISLTPGGLLAAGNNMGEMKVWNVQKSKPTFLGNAGAGGPMVGVTSDGRWLLGSASSWITRYSIEGQRLTKQPRIVLPHKYSIEPYRVSLQGMSLSPNNDEIAIADVDKRLMFIGIADGRVRREWVTDSPIGATAYSADGKLLAAGTSSGHIFVIGIE